MASQPLERLKSGIASLDARSIDELYGLEPVFEPGAGAGAGDAALGEFIELQCPWCAEVYGTHVDLIDHSRFYIEDCQVCCQPIEVSLDVSEQGELLGATAGRSE
jgi:hypothetical protein